MLILSFCFLLVVSFCAIIHFSLFCIISRYSSLYHTINKFVFSAINSVVANMLFIWFFMFVVVSNVLGNIPIASVPTFLYFETLTLAVMFWVPLIICVSVSDFNAFFSHLLPYGCPLPLMLILPIIEGFSLMIRPLTLMIRLSTNLAAGHIIIYMFSYFTLLNPILPLPLDFLILVLYILEIFISSLQAYIFFSLMVLYGVETV